MLGPGMRLFKFGWVLVIPIYDGRECPECRALVCGRKPQQQHERWHRELDRELGFPDEAEEPGGYIVGHGELPVSVRGGSDEDNAKQEQRR